MIFYFKNNSCNKSKGIRNWIPLLYFTDPWYLPFPLMKRNIKCPIEKYVQVQNGFPTYNLWFLTSKIIYATNPRESPKLDPIGVFHGHLVLAISTHEEKYEVAKRKIRTCWNWFFNI